MKSDNIKHSLNYRPEIDGLRSLAIVPVVLFHAGFSIFSGGFLGVDVFFVISGYLITSILAQQAEQGQLSILKFYEKRARRILPALFLMLFVTSILYPLFNSHPTELKAYGISILSVLSFVSNVYFWTESGYFGTASEMTPLLHTWSLAVEEQFYIFLPLMVLFLYKQRKNHLISGITILSFLSLITSEWGARNSADANFYLLPSRLWELFIGSLCALHYKKVCSLNLYSKYAGFLSNLALITLTFSLIFFDSETYHPSSITLVPVLSVAIIILCSAKRSFTNALLTSSPLIWIGLLSYSIYLWHQPVLVFSRTSFGHELPNVVILVALFITLLISWLSWKFVEMPYRSPTKIRNKTLLMHIAIATSASLLIALMYLNNKSIQEVIDPESMKRFSVIQIASDHSVNRPHSQNCHIWSANFDESFIKSYDACIKKHGTAIFVLGGSHGMDMYNVVSYASHSPFVASVSRGFCRIHKPLTGKRPHKCQYKDFNAFLESRSNSIKTLIYTQTGDRLIEGGLRSSVDIKASIGAIDEIFDYLSKIKSNNSFNVVIVGSLPTLNFGPNGLNYKKPLQPQLENMYSQTFVDTSHYIDNLFSLKAAKTGIQFFSKIEMFQLQLPQDLIIDGQLTYSDSRHISRFGAKVFAKRSESHILYNLPSRVN